jgi:acyl-CoA synthetase (AMP-forming)/AMP-acid ligase II
MQTIEMKRYIEVVNWGSAYAALARRFAARSAVSTPNGEHDFADVIGRAAAVAAALRARGLEAGSPVATVLPNRAHAVWGSIGITLSGAAEVSLNAVMTAAELKYCLDLIEAKAVIADEKTAATVRSAGYRPLLIEEIGATRADVVDDAPVSGDLWGKVLFTSGTTGRPKAIVHTHRGRWLANQMLRANLPFMPTPQTRLLLMTPYSHGASLLTGAFFDTGASIHLMNSVDVAHIRALLTSGAIDCMFAPPTVLSKITDGLSNFKTTALRAIFTGTATLSAELYQRTKEMFGPIVRVTYGKTEIFNPITVLEPADTDAAYAMVYGQDSANLGWPVSGVEISIRDEDGKACLVGTAGRIFLRAPHMMSAYIDDAGLHEVGPEDWHESGDVGLRSPRGELLLAGRENEVIKTGGYKLFPQEVEASLMGSGIASEVVAVGVPSVYWGQIVVLVAEQPAAGWEEQAAAAFETLSRYKRPRAYIAVPQLPRNAQGKLQRPKVLEMILNDYVVDDGPHPVIRRVAVAS